MLASVQVHHALKFFVLPLPVLDFALLNFYCFKTARADCDCIFSSSIISFSFPCLSFVHVDFMTQAEVNCLSIFHLLSQRESSEPVFRCFGFAGFLIPCMTLNYGWILVQIRKNGRPSPWSS